MRVPVVTAAQAAQIDAASIAGGNPSRALMQRAGHAAAAELTRRFPQMLSRGVAIYAGSGNNGGDAWVVAHALRSVGIDVRIAALDSTTSDCRAERNRFTSQGDIRRPDGSERLVVDGLLGTGSNGNVREPVLALLHQIAAARRSGAVVASLDVPSGMDATSGASEGHIQSDICIAFGTLKRAHVLARNLCGRIVVVDIGLDVSNLHATTLPLLLDQSWVMRNVPQLAHDVHKGERGRLAIVGGAPGMYGAAALCCDAALRSGIGLVQLVLHGESIAAAQASAHSAIASPWPTTAAAARRSIGDWAHAAAVGPGLGTAADSSAVLKLICENYSGPLLLDADALNLHAAAIDALAERLRGRNAIVTPHVGEMSRLTGLDPDAVLATRFEAAAELARRIGAVVLLKAVPTIIAAPDGRTAVCATGNHVLATGGSGDMLAGIAGTLLAQTQDAFAAAACAAWIHGRAADLAVQGGAVRGHSLPDVLRALLRVWAEPVPPAVYPVLAELDAPRQ